MRILYLDFETSDTKKEVKTKRTKKIVRSPSPYLSTNFLVSFGYKTVGYAQDSEGYHFFRHNEFKGTPKEAAVLLQRLLDECELLVAFNAKFELSWLLEAGFKYSGAARDPMIVEYVLARGVRVPLNLEACAERRKVASKKKGLVQEHWDNGLSFHEIPIDLVEEYGRGDVEALYQLDRAHQELLDDPENKGLLPTIQMSMDFIPVLVEMDRNGIAIDRKALDEVRREFTLEYQKLREDLEKIVRDVMGDTPINLDSPDDLSQVIYSRKLKDKSTWKDVFNIGTDNRGKRKKPPRMSPTEFVNAVRTNTDVIRRTEAQHCNQCAGKGLYHKRRKDGSDFKKPSQCKNCEGRGYVLVDTGKIAGLRVSPQGPFDTVAGGFAADKDTLAAISARLRPEDAASEFVTKLIRYNAVGTYLDTFVAGIERGVGDDNILHPQLLQHITRTARLCSREPNFQNIPRGGTFPVKRTVCSRWASSGGEILEVDFAQLEFRIAAFLAQDRQAVEDIAAKIDVHTRTAGIIECTRQDAKPHTFKPLYGGASGTDSERKYYSWFKAYYKDIGKWQQDNIERVLRYGKIAIPSGREYSFPGTRRTPTGYVTNSTQICNYPVQGFATADLVPVALIEVYHEILSRGLRSKLILTVHDSIEFDVFPGERQAVISCIDACFSRLPRILNHRYGIELNVPMGWEIKGGMNWLQMKELAKGGHV